MKIVSIFALCAVSPFALGGVYLADGASAGTYAGKTHEKAPAHTTEPVYHEPSSAPVYVAPTAAPAYTPPTPEPNHYTEPTHPPTSYTATPVPYTEPTDPPTSYTATPAPYTMPEDGYGGKTDYEMPEEPKCWTETRKCCFEEKADGYECKDDYSTKQSRCYPKIKYVRKCDKTKADDKPKKPKSYVNYNEVKTVKYDEGYGPHMAEYPTGVSETYETKKLPKKPYGVEVDPYSPPTTTPASYTSPEHPAGSGYGYSAGGNGYEVHPTSASNGY